MTLKLLELLWEARKQARRDKEFQISDDIRFLLEKHGIDVLNRDALERGSMK